MTLEIADGDGVLDGVFAFNVQGQSGSFRVAGRLLPDGRFTFVPREWIERPTGFTALGIEGVLNPNGRLIEGEMSPCMMSAFKATRAQPDGFAPSAEEPPAPLQTGTLTGLWQGGIGCSMNRRGNTEIYPLSLQLFADGDGLGALAWVQIYKKLNSGAGEAFDQYVLLSGNVSDGEILLQNHLLVDRGGAPVALQRIAGGLGQDGRIEGEVKMGGCKTVSLARAGDAQPASLPPSLAGLWIGAGGRQGDTTVSLYVVTDAVPPFVELRATHPSNLPAAERDRLRTVLAPVMEENGRILLVPISLREATGIFRPEAHALTSSRGLVIGIASEGSLQLRGVREEKGTSAAMTGAALVTDRERLSTFSLTRPSDAEAAAVAAGEAPPVDLGAIGGTLAAAPSREAQCRVLDAWIQPHSADADVDRMSIDSVRAALAGAFADEVFEPVFGMPLVLTTQQERSAVTQLIHSTCSRGMGLRVVGFVGDFILGSENQFADFNIMMADRAETGGWIARTEAELASLSEDASGLGRIEELRKELSERTRDLAPHQKTTVELKLAERDTSIRLAIFLSEADALPETGLDDGALNRVFVFMDRLSNSGFDHAMTQPIRDRVETKARAILDQPLHEAAALAAALPLSLDGMRQGQAKMNRLLPYREGMDRHFGTIDRDGVLKPLYTRLSEIQNDLGVQSAFREVLLSVDAGQDPRDSVLAVASVYVDVNELHRLPEFAAIVETAISHAEVSAVSVVDVAANSSPGEPTAEDIASFALQRVRDLNAELAAAEAACTSGQISDPLQALGCLSQPALYTGQTGFGARLLEVRKLGCTPEVPDAQYRCTFTQEIQINIPGGDAFGGGTMTDMAQRMSSGEAVDARFIRAKGGGWTVVWGSLD